MKTIRNFNALWMLIGSLMILACNDFTEVDLPQTQLTGSTVYQSEATATAAISDIYARLRENGILSGNLDGLNMTMGLYTDDLTYYGSATLALDNFFNHTIIPSNDYAISLWRNSYSQIYATNALLDGLSNSNDLTVEFKNRLKGEALFIRAILHFYLANLYGDVPYISTTDYMANSQVSRESIEIVFDKIRTDLELANELLSFEYIATGRVRVNKAAVQTLLARLYVYQEQWSLAESFATSVINQTSLYSIEPNINLAFLKSNPSTIWQLHSGIAGANTLEGRFFIFNSGPPTMAAISNNLLNAFENSDLRKQYWLKSITGGSKTWYHPYKYKQNANTGTSQEYSIKLRLEELYLIRAEARIHQLNISGAQQDLNTIRNRAGLDNISITNQNELLMAILNEKRFEFFTEMGHRWFDLKRYDLAQEVLEPLKPSWMDRNLLLPIPETELILNPNLQPQNTGY
jgi:hypothetical protein